MAKLLAKKIATGLARPVFATSPPGDKDRFFIAEQKTGKIRIFRPATGVIDPTPFLQVTGMITTGNEQGLLGLAFAPDFATSGFLYVNLTEAPKGATVVRRYKVSAANANVADPASALNLITVPQPTPIHNGGWIAFSPKDKFLYVSVGDGGPENDGSKTGQNTNMLLGKMLRIDVTKDGFPTDPTKNYALPADNPFVGKPGFAPEIWALGLRNPWRCSFDRKTADLYIGDVGQNKFEEIDFQPAASKGGENYGWSLREGKHAFNPPTPAAAAPGLTDPIFEYTHNNGEQGVVGGYVYRGAAKAGFQGTDLFADITGLVSSFSFTSAAVHDLTDRTAEMFPSGGPAALSSFAEDTAGELYLLNLIPGELHKILPNP